MRSPRTFFLRFLVVRFVLALLALGNFSLAQNGKPNPSGDPAAPVSEPSGATSRRTSQEGEPTESSEPARGDRPAEVLARAAQAVTNHDLGQAISQLEDLADAGVRHPDISFTRGVAYLRRAASRKAQAGDYGQAAAAFREALLLRPGDPEAKRGLEEARLEVAKRSTQGKTEVIETLGLGQRLLFSVSPWLLWALGAASSIVATFGILFFRFGKGTAKTGGAIAAGIGAILLLVCLPLSLAASHLRSTTRVAVVIKPRAPVLGPAGRAKKGVAPLPEGTEVRIARSRGHLVQLTSASGEHFLRRSHLRILEPPGS